MRAWETCSFILLIPRLCNAWGTVGHEVIANVAWNLLSDKAQRWAEEILNVTQGGDSTQTPLGVVADWADQVRNYMPWSSSLHFIDIRDDLFGQGCHIAPQLDPGCRFEYDRDCVDGRCAAGAIVNYTHQLLEESHTTTWNRQQAVTLRGSVPTDTAHEDSPTKEALMFVIHFVGDIHQPLHCSRATDKGGNDFKVHFTLTSSKKQQLRDYRSPIDSHHHSWNLHSVWDTGLIEVALKRDYSDSQSSLEKALLDELKNGGSIDDYLDCDNALGASLECTTQWGQESWDAAIRFAYTLDDNQTDVTDGATLDEGYYETRWPIAKSRLLAGSVRLAATLELIANSNTTESTRTWTNEDALIESATLGSGFKSLMSWVAWQ